MRKILTITLFSAIALSAVMLSSCKKEETGGVARMVGFYVTPASSFVEIGESVDLTVWASYTDGSTINMTDSVQIVSSSTSVVTVENAVATAVGEGRSILTATYKDRMDTCSFTVSSIEKITLSIDGVDENLLVLPEDEFSADKIVVTAYFKTGDSKNVDPDTLFAINDELLEVVYKDGKLNGLNVASVQDDSTQLFTYYTTANGTKLQAAPLDVFVGKLDTVEFSLGATIFDTTGKAKYKIDTLQLGEKSAIKADGIFSWTGFETVDTVDAMQYVTENSLKSSNTAILGVDSDDDGFWVIANDTTVKGTPVTFSAVWKFDGDRQSITYSSRPIEIKKDTTYKKPTYMIEISTEYAYVGDVITYKFLEDFGNDVVVDLTNTGNAAIRSTFAIKGKPVEGSTFPRVTSTGVLTFSEKVTAQEDSASVCIIYGKDTTYSAKFRVYNNPTMKIKEYPSGARSILLNSPAKHLWKKDCIIVDNFGKDYTEEIHYDSSNDYVLDLKYDDMWGKTYTFYYGPEERTAVLAVPAKPGK